MTTMQNDHCTDSYPSRQGNVTDTLPRQDPVVYGKEIDKAPIDSQQIQQYREKGFLILDNLFQPDEVEVLLREAKRLQNDPDVQAAGRSITEAANNEVRSVFYIHETSPVFKALARDNRLAGLASFLLDDGVYIHQSRINFKPGFRGEPFYWHSDFETWHVEDGMPRMRALSISIALTENDATNGALMLIPGSHQKYIPCQGNTPKDHFKQSLQKQEVGVPDDDSLASLAREEGIVTAATKPGRVILFDCNIMHGSNSNISPTPRSNVFFVYNALSNQVTEPFCNQAPRPEFVCSRETIHQIHP